MFSRGADFFYTATDTAPSLLLYPHLPLGMLPPPRTPAQSAASQSRRTSPAFAASVRSFASAAGRGRASTRAALRARGESVLGLHTDGQIALDVAAAAHAASASAQEAVAAAALADVFATSSSSSSSPSPAKVADAAGAPAPAPSPAPQAPDPLAGDSSLPFEDAFEEAADVEESIDTLTNRLPRGGEGAQRAAFDGHAQREAQLRIELAQARADAAKNLAAARLAQEKLTAETKTAAGPDRAVPPASLRQQMLSALVVQADALGAGEWLQDRLSEYHRAHDEIPIAIIRELLEKALPAALARQQSTRRREAAAAQALQDSRLRALEQRVQQQQRLLSAAQASSSGSASSQRPPAVPPSPATVPPSSPSTSAPLAVSQVEAATGFAPCKNAHLGCPCPASFDGEPGHACCRTCNSGTVCTEPFHVRPFPEYLAKWCPVAAPAPAPAADGSASGTAPVIGLRGGGSASSLQRSRSAPPLQLSCRFPGCSKRAQGGAAADDSGLFCGPAHHQVYSHIAKVTGGSMERPTQVRLKCHMPGCNVIRWKTEAEIEHASPADLKFCSSRCIDIFQAVAAASGGSLSDVLGAPAAPGLLSGGTQAASQGSLRSGPRPVANALPAGVQAGDPRGLVPLSAPLFNDARRLAALGAEGVQSLQDSSAPPSATSTQRLRQQAMDRVANELRTRHGPLAGGLGTTIPDTRPIFSSLGSGGAGAGGTGGAYSFDRSVVKGYAAIKHDECKLRQAPVRRMAPGEPAMREFADIVLNGSIPGRAASVPIRDSNGFVKMSSSGSHLLYPRQIRSLRALHTFVRDGLTSSEDMRNQALAQIDLGRDVAKWQVAAAHWREWWEMLSDFQEGAMAQYARVTAPALSSKEALAANDVFWDYINIVVLQHHMSVMNGAGVAIFAATWSPELMELAKLAKISFYKVPPRTKDIWEAADVDMLRARHGLPPAGSEKKKPKKPPRAAAVDTSDPAKVFDLAFNSIASGAAKLTRNQKRAFRKLIGVAEPAPPKAKPKCSVCGSTAHSKAQCKQPGGGKYVAPAGNPRTPAGASAP